jgi:RHS repeat-associated protein
VKKLTRDGVGRLATVVEAPGTSDEVTTSYTYNALDHLRTVNQAGQTRTFLYDTLGRLTSADNPETGVVNYNEYDLNGNLTRKTDARGVVTALEYDDLDRLKKKSYTLVSGVEATSQVDFLYDTNVAITGVGTENRAVGRLTQVSNESSATVYRYDGLGRALASRQTTDGTGYVLTYTQSPAGMASITYPSGRVVTQSYDEAGRVASLAGTKQGESPKTYAGGLTYAPHGALAQAQFLSAYWESRCYNSRLQETRLAVGITATTATVCGATPLASDFSALRLDYGYPANNNGNVASQTILVNGAQLEAQSYTYDLLNRLKSVSADTGWSQTYVYDRYGNRTQLAGTANGNLVLSGVTPQVTTDSAAQVEAQFPGNRWTGATIEATSGNVLRPKAGAYPLLSYDGENRVTGATTGVTGWMTAAYDGEGRRVKRTVNGVVTRYVYDALGRLAAEYSDAVTGESGPRVVVSDVLGSTRLLMSSSGVTARYDYLPFGEEIPAGLGGRTTAQGYLTQGAVDPQRVKFTGKERDGETGLDFFEARYLSSAQGRFTSPDPATGWASDPQSWNMYAYGRNNPLLYTDPDGQTYRICDSDGKNCRDVSDAQFADYRGGSQGLGFVGGSSGSIYAKNQDGSRTYIGSFKQTDVDLTSSVFMAAATGVLRAEKPVNYLGAALLVGGAAAGVAIAGPAIAAGTGLTTVNLTGAAQAAALTLPAGAKLAQMIARSGNSQFIGNPQGFLSFAREFIATAIKQGTYASGDYISRAGSTIYRVGNDFMTVAKDGRILSYVQGANAGGVTAKYSQLGGR